MKRYNPKDIEPKWQQAWGESDIYKADDTSTKPKKFILEFFPYPSGAAMHVGHVRNYAIGDAISRFARMRGYNVLHPMGWDAFGLPAENYAIKTGISPQQAIEENTGRFKQQLTQMGFSYDWSREFASSDPSYYKWTQWFFLMLFKKGLAYQKESLQWWCPVDKTVLANEQVEAGRCWRCGSEVEKKALKQWFFKITDYADRLAKDLDNVDWSDSIKNMQRNWIGRSKGAEINFALEQDVTKALHVFTTRPDTIFGVTFMVIAPEHPMIAKLTTPEHQQQVENYLQKSRNKSEVERQETNREKTGVFTGSYVINPMNGEKVPVWVADYVLMGYGTGAIMAVPAHDERDHDFAKKFGLDVKPVLAPAFGEHRPTVTDRPVAIVVMRDPKTDRYCVLKWKEDSVRKDEGMDFPGGGIDEGETIEQGALREVREETGYTDVKITKVLPSAVAVYYHSSDGRDKRAIKNVVLAELQSDAHNGFADAEDYEKDAYDVEWLTRDEIMKTEVSGSITAVINLAFTTTIHIGEGVMINSGAYDNLTSSETREKIVADLATQNAGHERINYKMRDWLISRQRYWGAPIPIIHCAEHGAVAVPDDQLPVQLPDIESFEPSGDGRSPLARVPEFVNTTCPTCGGPATRETDTMDGFACSSWYFLRFADPHNADKPFDDAKAKYWLPVDEYIGGAEHAVMHLLYARMWTKVMFDEGMINFDEPFVSLRNQGMILAPDGQKMSKSKGNTIQPGELIDQGYGADSIRIMEFFIGPWNQMANWSVEGMGGSFRFLQRFWNLAQEYAESGATENTADTKQLKQVMHRTIKKVSFDLENMGFNTAIAALMEALNDLYKLKAGVPFATAAADWRWALETFAQLLAPFAPHMTEELWHELGHASSIHTSEWPVHDEKYLVSDTMTIVVQVNGKLRAQLQLPVDATRETVLATAEADAKVQLALNGQPIKKPIYVPGKLVNFVV
ncbi:MAG: leucine--tRNA ligase [Candidatus Saccharibacteria bacterium]